MIILDTNVISALASYEKVLPVQQWVDNQEIEQLWITAITVFELRMGIEKLVSGRKRRYLEESTVEAVSGRLEGRVLPFDVSAADHAARIYAKRSRFGRPMDVRDAQIGGIAIARQAALATRNVRDFANLGIVLVDPWTA
jgi:predicted nucleic acid-binding protein